MSSARRVDRKQRFFGLRLRALALKVFHTRTKGLGEDCRCIESRTLRAGISITASEPWPVGKSTARMPADLESNRSNRVLTHWKCDGRTRSAGGLRAERVSAVLERPHVDSVSLNRFVLDRRVRLRRMKLNWSKEDPNESVQFMQYLSC